MIVKTLDMADVYRVLSPLVGDGIDWLRTQDFANVDDGRYELCGDELVAIVESYETVPPEKKRWEAHQRYVDLQYVASGRELMGYAPRAMLREATPHDEAKDVAFFDAASAAEAASFVRLREGMFVMLGPEDVHLPGVSDGSASKVKKVVLKLAAASFR